MRQTIQWNENDVILTKFSSLAALEIVIFDNFQYESAIKILWK